MSSVLVSTPAGPGGIAVLQVIGADAVRVAVTAGIRLEPAPAFSRAGDDLLAHVVAKSPWGLPTVEISCHGGSAAPDAVIRRLGVGRITWDEALDDAVRRRAMDRPRAEARRLLAEARTPLAAAMLTAQVDGALSKAIAKMKSPKSLLATARSGRALVDPPRVVIAGRPNAGKSTLLNALARQDRALVSDIPGTTRDPVDTVIDVDGFPIRLIDTAGLMSKATGVDREAVARTAEQREAADLVVWLRDGREPVEASEGIAVANKADLPGASTRKGELAISAKTGAGLSKLKREIVKRLALRARKGAMVFTKRQQTLLEALAAGAGASEIRQRLLWT